MAEEQGADETARPRPAYLRWTTIGPVLALFALVVTWERVLPPIGVITLAILLGVAVMAAVHHAEIVAHRVGEPFGSLVLAVAVTVIEVGLIVTLMITPTRTPRAWPVTPCSPR